MHVIRDAYFLLLSFAALGYTCRILFTGRAYFETPLRSRNSREIYLDLILYGLPQNMPVDREILTTGFQFTPWSSSAVHAHNLVVLGVISGFTTRVGSVPLRAIALERPSEANVNLSRVMQTAGALRWV